MASTIAPLNLTPKADIQGLPSIASIPTTELTIPLLASLSEPVFTRIQSRQPYLQWAGVFGSVARGNAHPESDVDVLVGYSASVDMFKMFGTLVDLQEGLAATFGRSVDVINVVEARPMGYVQMEGLLTCKTLWGDPAWPENSRAEAEGLLRDGYRKVNKAARLAEDIFGRLPSSQESFTSPENSQLTRSILEDVLAITDLLKFEREHPFNGNSKSLFFWIFQQESNIRAILERENEEGLDSVWSMLSDKVHAAALTLALNRMAEQTFRRANLSIPETSD